MRRLIARPTPRACRQGRSEISDIRLYRKYSIIANVFISHWASSAQPTLQRWQMPLNYVSGKSGVAQIRGVTVRLSTDARCARCEHSINSASAISRRCYARLSYS